MGQVSSLSSALSRTRKLDHKQFNEWDIIKKHENLDCPLHPPYDCLKSGRAKSQCNYKTKNKAKKEEQMCQKPCDDELLHCNRNRDQPNDTWNNDVVDWPIDRLWGN